MPSFSKGARGSLSLFLAAISMILGPLLQYGALNAYASGISTISDTMTNQAPSATSDHTFVFTSTGQNLAGDSLAIDLVAADFTLNSAATWQTSDFALTDTNHSAKAPLAVGASPSCTATDNYTVTIDATNSTFTITFCSSWVANTAATATTFKVFGTTGTGTGTVTNSASDTNSSIYTITYSGTNTTSGQGAVVIETNANVSITATVNSTLTFSNDDNAIGFGTLDPSAARYANAAATGSASDTTAHTMTVSTNASSGYTLTAYGATLTSGSYTISNLNSATASSPGSEQFGLYMVHSGGSGTVTAPFDDNSTPKFAFTNAMTSGTATEVAASSTATNTDTYAVHYLANIAGTTEAGSYSTTVYYVATGRF